MAGIPARRVLPVVAMLAAVLDAEAFPEPPPGRRDRGPDPTPPPAPERSAPVRLEPEPRPILLDCPECKRPHVDLGVWAMRPHKTHLCEHCKHEWQPYDHPTVGVPRESRQVMRARMREANKADRRRAKKRGAR